MPPLRLPRAVRLLRRRQGQGVLRGDHQTRRAAPRRGLRLPALPGEADLPAEGDDVDGRSSPALFELVEAWALEDHDGRN